MAGSELRADWDILQWNEVGVSGVVPRLEWKIEYEMRDQIWSRSWGGRGRQGVMRMGVE